MFWAFYSHCFDEMGFYFNPFFIGIEYVTFVCWVRKQLFFPVLNIMLIYNNPGKNTCKNIYKAMVNGTLIPSWMVGKHPSKSPFSLLWLRKLEKTKKKQFGKENFIFCAFIYENNGNYDKRKVEGHRLHVRRKIMEI